VCPSRLSHSEQPYYIFSQSAHISRSCRQRSSFLSPSYLSDAPSSTLQAALRSLARSLDPRSAVCSPNKLLVSCPSAVQSFAQMSHYPEVSFFRSTCTHATSDSVTRQTKRRGGMSTTATPHIRRRPPMNNNNNRTTSMTSSSSSHTNTRATNLLSR